MYGGLYVRNEGRIFFYLFNNSLNTFYLQYKVKYHSDNEREILRLSLYGLHHTLEVENISVGPVGGIDPTTLRTISECKRSCYMHHLADRIVLTTVFVTLVLEREIA